MFKLNRLELSGFKSFVDPVNLEVSGRLTAIVGPNGCGKSNIADAFVWVLGERSAKSLRGEKMEDVIFAGAKSRRPLGMAEVNLELLTDNGFAKAEDGRIRIGRRIYRTGESQYLLNGKVVRLKDIKDLLMDTGLGIRAYSMIEQGKIGMILSGKPQERRRLLEEAAGVTRYRERRRLAEIKLEEAKANLARLDDIVSEVERALRSLKRQSNAARRYGERQEEFNRLLRQVLEGRWTNLQLRLADYRSQIEDLVSRESEQTAALHRQEATQTEAGEELERLSRQLADRHSQVADLAATIEGKQEFIKGSRERLQELTERVTAGRAAAEERRIRLQELEAGLTERQERVAQLREERERAQAEVNEDEARIAQVETLTKEAEERQASLRDRLLSSINELSGLRNRLHQEQVEREKGKLRSRHVEQELEKKAIEVAKAEQHLRETEGSTSELRSMVEEQEGLIGEHRARLEELKGRQSELAGRQDELEQELTDLSQRQRLLAQLSEEQDRRRAAVRKSLAEAGLEDPTFLGDSLKVPEEWTASLDLYLGELENAVVLEDGTEALDLARALEDGQTRGSLLQPARESSSTSTPDDPAIHSSLGEALSLPTEVVNALPPAYLVESSRDARRLAKRHPGLAFISRDRLWAQAGVLHVQGQGARPGQLERETELAAISRRLRPLEKELAGVTQEIETLAAEHRDQEDSIRRLEAESSEARQTLAVADARLRDASARKHRLEEEHRTLQQELGDIGQEIGKVADDAAFLAERLHRGEVGHGELETAFDEAQKEVDQIRQERETTRTSGVSRRGRLELVAQRFEASEDEITRYLGEIEQHRHQIDQWQDLESSLDVRGREIQDAMKQSELDLQKALENRDISQQDVLAAQDRLDEHRARVRELAEQIEVTREQRDALRSETSEVRVSEAAVKQDSEHLVSLFREEFDEAPPEEVGAPAENLDELEVDLDRRRQAIERLGPVNLLAAKEYEEQSERHIFLTEQRADVRASVKRLTETIREINETSSQRFKETFETVNRHFRETFVELFRGGEAEMRLLDPDDMLETVIEIVARPPGKRLQNLMLLSGGEKALTAIALLFSLFKAKPSPFCILDEVDAPLDDINTLRFVELLRTMSGDTQFVVITHNKLTMEAASLLYGVTMQESGVSNLVSVELDAVQPELEPQPAAAAG
ncbi:MAG: chromosome segregation protein SMC [Thermoanaerobaculia bacterium]